VRRGQTLSGIAHEHHVPMQELAAANALSPPYRIEAGRILIIPHFGQPAPPPVPASPPLQTTSETAAAPARIEAQPLDRPPPAPPENSSVAALPPPSAPPMPVSPPTGESLRLEPAPTATPPAHAATSQPPAAPAPTPGGGTFLWPVRGRVLVGYGSRPDGTHNDGINIAAPRGAAIEATDAGVVAYAGNELRGYGNLILVKHANGWISAYAHCELMLVKRGDKVGRGQIIARVGSTGNVGEPQLHFELRRGNHAVDPRGFLIAPATAQGKEGHRPS
jgi:murein DD-endopeptidase MepM/ murein hydrolase activator NlpD